MQSLGLWMTQYTGQVSQVITKAAADGSDVAEALRQAMGQPWLDDWHANSETPAPSANG